MASAKTKSVTKTAKLMVAAIDFGTTYSGWAYSFDNDYKADPTKVYCKNWCSGKHMSSKAPTTVLVKPDGKTLEAFGYEAEDKYAALADEDEHRAYYYFKHFKMMLYDNKELNRYTVLEDDKGKQLPAQRVFAMVIKFLKDSLLLEVNKKIAFAIDEKEIQWVLTVPAIWNPRAKQFMRESAVQAGIESSNLLIALEPEAASMYCKYLAVQRQNESDEAKATLKAFQPGTRYMVVDAGGGTIDIIEHEVASDGSLEEIYAANGGNWGGKSVDNAFFEFLTSIVGEDVIKRLKENHMDDYLDIQREFDVKKRGITQSDTGKVKIKLPVSLSDLFTEIHGKTVMAKVATVAHLEGKVKFMADKVLIDSSIITSCFQQSTTAIVNHIKTILGETETKGTDTILMVGGYSESSMLFDCVRDAFPGKTVLLPEEAGLSVLKGAVIFGHCKKDIALRISPFTYGFKMYAEFDPSIHPRSRMIIKDGRQLVQGSFCSLVSKGAKITPQSKSGRHSLHAQSGHTSFALKLFASVNPYPLFVDDPTCYPLGEVLVDCTDSKGQVGSATVFFLFGETEFEVNAVHNETGEQTKASFDFLD